MGEKLRKVNNMIIEWGNPEKLNKVLDGTGYTVSERMEIIDDKGVPRGALSLAYIDDKQVKINSICPYGGRDPLAIAIDAGRK